MNVLKSMHGKWLAEKIFRLSDVEGVKIEHESSS